MGIITLALSLSSCSDYLEKQPDDQLTLEMVFNNKSNTDKWLANIYSYIPDTYSYGTIEPCGDDLVPSPRWEQFNFRIIQYQKGNWSPLSEGGVSYWVHLPKAIRAAYIFIRNVRALPGQQDQNQDDVNNMKAECDFLIAYYHSLLLMYYGAIPIIRDAYGSNISSEDLMVKQEPFYDAVEWIDKKLLDASQRLPATYTESKMYGRATSIMCLAVRARLLLFAASELVNGNPDFAGVKNSDGIPIFSSAPDRRRWEYAATACKQLIDEAEKDYRHKLYKEYLNDGITLDPFMSYQNVVLKQYSEGNTEILMDRPYSGQYGGYDKNSFPRGTGGIGAIGVSQALVDAFFMKDGIAPITGYDNGGETPRINPKATLYSETDFSTSEEKRKTRWPEGSSAGDKSKDENTVTLSGTFKMYCNREPRFYVSVLYNDAWCRYGGRVTDFYMNGKDGGPTHDAPQNGYLVRKKVDPDADPKNGIYKPRTAILFRLAEAYLSYAEALNEISYESNKPEILKYVNLIRERAGIPQYGKDGFFEPADQAEMRSLIRQERRIELNCESFIRFDDIRRWKQGHLIDGKCWGMNFNGTRKDDDPAIVDGSGVRQSFYIRDSYFTRKFISYWWPIPQSDMDKNPNLRQMPGW
jgi:hypothetical protein